MSIASYVMIVLLNKALQRKG